MRKAGSGSGKAGGRLLPRAAFLLALLLPGQGCAAPASVGRIGWAIQVGAFTEVRNAEGLADRLQRRGIDAFYFRNDRGFFAVRFGDFPSREEARKRAERLAGEGLIEGFFIAPPAGTAPLSPPRPPGRETSADLGSLTARTAERFVGIPYRWGGNNVAEGMDCSGFSRAVYHLMGVDIPRTAAAQFGTGRTVSRDALRDGDLVFFGSGDRITHVGVYVGGGRFVHAPRRGQDIMVSRLDEGDYGRKYRGARRYF